MIGNVFAHVGNGAVGAHDDLGVLIRSFLLARFAAGAAHHPAAFVLPFRLQVDHALLLKLGKSQLPEMQMKNLTFLGKEIVMDIQPLHGLEMTANDGVRDQAADLGGFIAALLNIMQGLESQFQTVVILLIPLRHPGIKVPAVVIKGRIGGGDEFFNLSLPFFLQIQETYHYVRHLHAGIIDVVLNVHMSVEIGQKVNKGVAQNGVTKVTDVSSLVGVNAGVFDQNSYRVVVYG